MVSGCPRVVHVSIGLLVLLAAIAVPVSATTSLECERVWKDPSAGNDVVECLRNTDRLKGHWRLLVLPGLNALLLLVTLLSFPILLLSFLICRRCCCTPNEEGPTRRARCFLWLWIIYAFLWSCAMLFFVVYGSRTFFRSAFDLLDDTVSGPLDYLNRTGERIIDFASDWSTGKRQPLDSIPLDLTALKTVHRTAMDSVELAREYQFKYFKWVSISTYCIGGLGFVLVALILPFAIFHCCIPWFPLILSCLYWVSGLVFSLLGVIFTLLAYAFFIGCGEVDLHYQRQPGLSQWYAVPYCQREFNFNKINAEIHATELQYSQQACSQLLDVCDNGAEISQAPLNVYAIKELSDLPVNVTEVIGSKVLDKVSKLPLNTTNITDFSEKNLSDLHDQLSKIPEGMEILKELNLLDKVDLSGGVPKFRGDLSKELQKIIRPLICGMDIVSADQCTNFGTVAAVLLTTKVKSFAKACPNPASTCSLPECAVNCTNNFVKSKAAEIVHKAHVAQNISIALSYARPLLDCNFVLDTAASALARCPDLRDGSLMLGVGFFVGGLTCALAIYIAFRGACIWSRPPLKRQRSLTSKEN